MKLACSTIRPRSCRPYGTLMLGLFCILFLDALAAPVCNDQLEPVHRKDDLGVVDLGSEVTRTSKGPINFIGRIIDTVRCETVDGCRVAFAVTDNPHSPNLHVLVDGKRVIGYDDVAWHSLVSSIDGKHFAFVANNGGKQVRVLDGATGQNCDKIGKLDAESGSPLVFSPDGRHLGYAAKLNEKWHVITDEVIGPAFDDVDGMLLTTYRKTLRNGISDWERQTTAGSTCPQFSKDGQHSFYLAQRKNGKAVRYSIALDGKLGPEFEEFWGAHLCPNGEIAYIGLNGFDAQMVFDGAAEIAQGGSELIFSANGKHHAYIAGKARSGTLSVVSDGKQGERFKTIDNLQFSPDGQHVFFNTYLENSGYREVVDGFLIPPVDGFRISRVYFSSDGERTVFLGEKSRDPVGDKALIENGKVIAVFPSSYWLFLSPDCRRVAYSKVAPGHGLSVILDGVEHPEMLSIQFETVKFSSDSRHFTYVGQDAQQRWRVIVDGVPGPQLDSLAVNHPMFNPAGDGYAYAGKIGAAWVVVTNGITGPKLDSVSLDSLIFSPDGRQVAYTANIGGTQNVVLNTTPGPMFAEIRPGSLVFSPNTKRLAYIVTDDADTGNGKRIKTWRVVMDGVAGTNFSEIASKNVVFSSDSSHWVYVARQDREEMLVIDNVEGPRFSSIEVGPTECRDGRLEYIAFDGDGAKRKLVRVTVKGFGPGGPQAQDYR